ncbi:MAG: hypothetical protein RL417_1171 [Pseudomonadota bacterium]|jgi:hypothetical protein
MAKDTPVVVRLQAQVAYLPLIAVLVLAVLVFTPGSLIAQSFGNPPTPTPGPTPLPQPCPCYCPSSASGQSPVIADYTEYDCPATMFDSCACRPERDGQLCGTVSEAMLKFDGYQAACMADIDANCGQCPNPSDPTDNRIPRNPNSCCPIPNGCPGHDCGFHMLFNCGPVCSFFEQFFGSVCSMLQGAIENGQEQRCVTLTASAGGADASIQLCCPQGSHISGCAPWNGDSGELNGQCEVLVPDSGCLAAAYICRCPGMSISCLPDGTPPTPTPANTSTPLATATSTPSPIPTPTVPPNSTDTPSAREVFIRE